MCVAVFTWDCDLSLLIPMSTTRDLEANRTEIDARLREAIDSWDPRRPRRWLAKHGGWRVKTHSFLTQRYCALRDEAQALLASIR